MTVTPPMLFVWLAFGGLLRLAAGLGVDSCILTPTTCQCSGVTKAGTCLRSQENGTCLLGQCSEGYKCDCFGYELCSVTTCDVHVPVGNVLPKENVPFQCKRNSTSGQCTSLVDVLDTLIAANNAERHASASHEDALVDESIAIRELQEIQQEKMQVHQMLKEVELVAHRISDEILHYLYVDAKIVEEAVLEAAVELEDIVREAKMTSMALRVTREHKRVAHITASLEEEGLALLEKEENNPEKNSLYSDMLRLETGQLNEYKKLAARKSGRKAKETGNHAKNIKEKMILVVALKEKAKTVGTRIFQKCTQSLNEATSEGAADA